MSDSGSDTGSDRGRRDQLVQSQYEAYPYPERKPADEKKRLLAGSPSQLAEVNHYVFGGRRDLSKPLAALVAGGGTGDAAIMLAQQMTDAGVPGEVVHLDQSEPAQTIAQERAKVRGLDNIRFVQGSLLDVADIAPGPWDYIDCCGVLHHLEDPDAGLAALASVLAPDGGLGVMVYGALGRTGIYHVQDMMRTLAPPGDDDKARVALTRRLVNDLPATAWLNCNGLVRDHKDGGDPGLYDIFLHARDRAYQVPEVANLVAGAGLRLVTFIEPYRYDPLLLVHDPQLKKALVDFDPLERAAFAELYLGNHKKHVFYAVRAANAVVPPSPDTPDAVPTLVGLTPEEATQQMPPGGKITVSTEGHKQVMQVPSLSRAIVALCDGQRDLAAIHGAIQEKRGDLDYDAFKMQFDQLYGVMNAINRMVLRLPID
ncbi:MAG: methyltransferase [Alphaproteobacteria bacterium]|nr:methyltransferase [Alphaproteobacteria bacterium]